MLSNNAPGKSTLPSKVTEGRQGEDIGKKEGGCSNWSTVKRMEGEMTEDRSTVDGGEKKNVGALGKKKKKRKVEQPAAQLIIAQHN